MADWLESTMDDRTCEHCGASIAHLRPHARYCDPLCRSRAGYLRQKQLGTIKRSAYEKLDLPERPCLSCGKCFKPSQRKSRFCSKPCSGRWDRAHENGECLANDCIRPVRAKGLCNMHYKALLRSEGRLSTKTPWTDERRDAYYRREALKRQTAVSDRPVILADIAERDGWKCGLCGKRVRKDLMHPHPMSRSLDHVIPLSRGGGHVPENCQLAHLRCNVSKGNREANEQLALLG